MRRHLLVPIIRCSREFRRREWRHLRLVPTPPPFRSTMTRLVLMVVGMVAVVLALAVGTS